MAENQRQFVGSGKKVGNYDLVNIALCVTDIPKDKIYEYNGKKYLNLTLGGKKNGKDEYGRTHSLWINDFKPDKTKARTTEKQDQKFDRDFDREAEAQAIDTEGMNPDDIPF